ncbi:MAG: hypothetical protein EBT09_05535 [Actinobacteria bacterium]|nr:hypothetical protein [Actinomycetota bacterium]
MTTGRNLPPVQLPENIAHLGDMRNWIAWERVPVLNDDGTAKINGDGTPKISKKPRLATGRHDRCHGDCTGDGGVTGTNRTYVKTWRTYAEVRTAIDRRPGLAGMGFVFPLEGGMVGVDLDHVIDADGVMNPEADAIIEQLGSYAEWSPSGTGIHILCLGTLPDGGRKRGNVEMYATGRYFTFTGRGYGRFGDLPIRDATAELSIIHAREFDAPAPQGMLPDVVADDVRPFDAEPMTDADLIRHMFAAKNGESIERLWHGDSGAHAGDASAGDLALCNHLAFWTNADRLRMDALFRASRRMRDKWDERHHADGRTYGEGTIDKAIARTTTTIGSRLNRPGAVATATRHRAVASDRLPLTDLGNAERLVRAHGDDIRWVTDWKAWIRWNGRYWERDTDGAVLRLTFDVVRDIVLEGDDEAVAKFAIRSEALQRMSAAVELAKSLPGISIRSEVLNRNRDIIVVRDGTLDLRTTLVTPHRREDLITTVIKWDGELAHFDLNAECPVFMQSLATWQPDPEVRTYLQRLAGYSLTGHVRERVIAIFWGTGRNGKSTFVEALKHTFGDHAHQSSTDLIMQRRGVDASAASPELAALQGKRLVVMDETSEGGKLDEARVKWLTGNDRLSARKLFGDPFEFDPTHTIILTTNHRPVIRSGGEAIWDRIHQVPWETRIRDADVDRTLPERLLAERPGIFTWLVLGSGSWYDRGLDPPLSVRKATDEYRDSSDWFGLFLEDCCYLAEGQMTTAKDLHKAYDAWAKESEERLLSVITLGRILSERGFRSIKNRRGERGWDGIMLTTR